MRIRWKAIVPVLGVVGAWLASPHALALVSEEHSHYLLAASSLIAVLMPALVTNRPKSRPIPVRQPSIPPEAPHDVGGTE